MFWLFIETKTRSLNSFNVTAYGYEYIIQVYVALNINQLAGLFDLLCLSLSITLLLWRRQNESSNSEVNEQVQIRSVHESARDQIIFVIRARVVVEFEVPSRYTNKGSDQHLRDLTNGDKICRESLGHHLQCLQAKVCIHEGMDRVVHGYKIQTRTGHSGVSVPAIK